MQPTASLASAACGPSTLARHTCYRTRWRCAGNTAALTVAGGKRWHATSASDGASDSAREAVRPSPVLRVGRWHGSTARAPPLWVSVVTPYARRAEGELWPVPERKTAAATLQLTREETGSSATRGASVKLQHNDEHMRRERRTMCGGHCGEKTVARRAHPGGGKQRAGESEVSTVVLTPTTPVSRQGPYDAWHARWAMLPDRWPCVGLRSTDEWVPRDRKF
jgi:hypothetical protein